jgi:hypothetical protein
MSPSPVNISGIMSPWGIPAGSIDSVPNSPS